MHCRLNHHVDVQINRRFHVRRRDFLKAFPAAGLAAGTLSWTDLMSLQADELRRRGMACILLWMQGGPSQFETFAPKPAHANGGETEAVATSVPGIHIAANLPRVAEVMDDICLIRSMTSREGSHPRATYLMQTGYLPMAGVKYPALGSIVAERLGDLEFDLPSFVRVGARGRGAAGGGLLGVDYDPFSISDPTRAPDNTRLTTSDRRYRRRLGLLGRLEDDQQNSQATQEVATHRKLYQKASRLVLSSQMNVFDIASEPETMRRAYGDSQFAAGCLLARRLVETGVTFVEVNAGNWDTHQDNFARSSELCQEIDQPYAQLLSDLRERGLLEKTLVLWMGEFGRTPRINARGGRDHFPRAFSLALAGGGVRGGQIVGDTDAAGEAVTDRPVTIPDLFRTICHALRIDADHANMSSGGRPIPIVEGGQTVQEVFRG